MKQYTHPKVATTLVQMTDGSFFIKKWIFFKEFLPLEIDVKSHVWWIEKEKTSILKSNLKKE